MADENAHVARETRHRDVRPAGGGRACARARQGGDQGWHGPQSRAPRRWHRAPCTVAMRRHDGDRDPDGSRCRRAAVAWPKFKGTIRRLHAESFKPAAGDLGRAGDEAARTIVRGMSAQLPRELMESVGGGG
jgi:hypothetical protein